MSVGVETGAQSFSRASIRRFIPQPIFLILFALLVWIAIQSPDFATGPVFMAFLKRAAPLMILAAGELFVIASGEFDLSIGSLITVVVVVAASLINNDPTRVPQVIALLFGIGIVVGLINGLVTTRLHVPSFITTLGMLLILSGVALYYTGGSPRGAVTTNFRIYGRGNILDVPLIEVLPYAVIVTLVVGVIGYLVLHRTTFGHRLLATGGNPRAAHLSGVNVANVRTLAFVLSALFATVAGILVGGLYPITHDPGLGYEFQAISAVVLGGAVLGGGRGSLPAAMAGALSLYALFTLLNVLGLPTPLRPAVQGVIIIGAMAFAAYRLRRSSQ